MEDKPPAPPSAYKSLPIPQKSLTNMYHVSLCSMQCRSDGYPVRFRCILVTIDREFVTSAKKKIREL